jgi:hypothetical protein
MFFAISIRTHWELNLQVIAIDYQSDGALMRFRPHPYQELGQLSGIRAKCAVGRVALNHRWLVENQRSTALVIPPYALSLRERDSAAKQRKRLSYPICMVDWLAVSVVAGNE